MKKGQITIGALPIAVLTVGMVFLVLATVAYVGEKYGDAIRSDSSGTTVNETLTTVNEAGEYLYAFTSSSNKDPSCTVTQCVNATSGIVIPAVNYTATGCKVKWAGTGLDDLGSNNTNWKCTYTWTAEVATSATNVTTDLQTNISDNTSIAGIVLTIILVAAVLTILMGIFLITRQQQPM